MSATNTTENTVETFVVSHKVWLPSALVLAVVGGLAAAFVVTGIDWPDDAEAATALAPFTLTVAGVLLGGGLGLLLADIRTTTKTVTTSAPAGGAESTGPEDVVVKSFEVLKDLSAGKASMVLGIVLIVVSMWTVNG